jgi:VIT1/CCC1 family predicted Fe2+/Mn2+ transporter
MKQSTAYPPKILKRLKKAQVSEITEYRIYSRLAALQKDPANAGILRQIAEDEKGHHDFWAERTGYAARPRKFKAGFFIFVSRLFGLTFGVKLMEKGEGEASVNYDGIAAEVPEAEKIAREEDEHEKKLLNMLNEERLEYMGSVVLGLNDALVELTGALAGLSFAFQKTRLIALAGLITGVAASMSMAASEYLSSRHEGSPNAGKSALYTGMAYIITVFLLILPYFLLDNYLLCLGMTLSMAVLIIFFFNFYISVAKDQSFWKRFGEMALISLGVSALSFGIGYLIRRYLGIDV